MRRIVLRISCACVLTKSMRVCVCVSRSEGWGGRGVHTINQISEYEEHRERFCGLIGVVGM